MTRHEPTNSVATRIDDERSYRTDYRRAMTVLGLPIETVVVFVATVVAGSIGAAHYALANVVRDDPFGAEEG